MPNLSRRTASSLDPRSVEAMSERLFARICRSPKSSGRDAADLKLIADTVAVTAIATAAAINERRATRGLICRMNTRLAGLGGYVDYDPAPGRVHVCVRFREDDGRFDSWRRLIVLA